MREPEDIIQRAETLHDVAGTSHSLADFGLNLRDWQHVVRRDHVHSRKELARRMEAVPPRLAHRFPRGDVADAYLAAYAEWIADRAGIPRPEWCANATRCAEDPWFSTPTWGLLLARAPASFRQRNLFTIPEPVFTPRCGRPRVSAEQKREKARQRQRAYRVRVRKLLAHARRKGCKVTEEMKSV